MQFVYAVVSIILVIGVLASIYGYVNHPTGAAVSEFFKVGLAINHTLMQWDGEAFVRENTTALDVLAERFNFMQQDRGGGIQVTAILLDTIWAENTNTSEWVFLVNGEIKKKNDLVISPNRYYLLPGDNITFSYVSKNT